MNTPEVRVILQYGKEKLAVLFPRNLKRKEFIEKCLNEFNLDQSQWSSFEVIHVKLDCKITDSNLLRFEDEQLLLKEVKQNQIVIDNTKIAQSYEEDSIEMLDLEERFQERLSLDNTSFKEILMTKEEVRIEKSDFNNEEDRKDFCEEEIIESNDLINHSIEEEKEEDFYTEETVINLDEIKSDKFIDREELKEKVIRKWGGNKKIKLNFRTQERVLIKDDTKVFVILCSKKDMLGCPFYLEFRTNSEDNFYNLASFWNVHNHSLDKYDTSHAIDEEILESIKSFRNSAKSISEFTKSINEKYQKNFHRLTIYNLMNKLKDEEFGKMNKDAETFIKMLEEDHKKRDGFYKVKLNEQVFEGCCYMSKRMIALLDYFSDVIIIDASHGTNRFNLPFLDIVIINNSGQTCLCYFSLLPNQKYESFHWSLENFRSKLKWTPKVIFSDDEEALRKGKSIFYVH